MGDKQEGQEKEPSRNLVRILIIVGIGIPILVELLTLLNLINVRIFETEDHPNQQLKQTKEVRTYSQGDTLVASEDEFVLLQSMKINVNARQWEFEISLSKEDSTGEQLASVNLDSIRLKSGEILDAPVARDWRGNGKSRQSLWTSWALPSGDMPYTIYLSYQQKVAEDSVTKGSREIRLGNIPVRYNRKEE